MKERLNSNMSGGCFRGDCRSGSDDRRREGCASTRAHPAGGSRGAPLAAFNGGFKTEHGHFGMRAGGVTPIPLVPKSAHSQPWMTNLCASRSGLRALPLRAFASGTDDARIEGVSTQERGFGEDEIALHLTRPEAELLEAQLSREVARIEDELVEIGDGASSLERNAEDLRRLDERLRKLLDFEPLPEIV
jgi:hypothetical protein